MSIEEVLRRLKTSIKGLSSSEAKRRLELLGPNEIPEKKVNPIIKFLSYFWGPIPWLIEVAAVISAAIRHWVDFWIIIALLLTNSIVGFWEEHKAENIISYLKQKLSVVARVLRDGNWVTLPARELVPGDIVRIRLGDIVPADIKLVEGEYLLVDESVLTGESMPVEKKVGDVVFSGSIVKRGEMTGVVIATGLKTYFGKTVELVEKAERISKYQKLIVNIGNYLIILTIILVSAMAIEEYLRGIDVFEVLKYSLVLVVAAIPAALPAVLSITMAIGAYELARKQAIVRKLVAIEELAGVDTLCVDKTGTLTKNQLTAADPVPIGEGYDGKHVILYAALASREEDKDPIDLAVLGSLDKYGVRDEYRKYKQLVFKPFDPVRKRTEAVVQGPGGEVFIVAKGAPQVILKLVGANDELRSKVMVKVDEYAEHGYRMIGVARSRDKSGKDWDYVGLIPLFDPPREDAKDTIQRLKKLGLDVKMVTGDHIAIAREVARLLGIGPRIYLIDQLKEAEDDKKTELVLKANGFAEVFPEHKYMIVDALQKAGRTVAMTGDGVNDAPALKKADVGIAVSNATDAARAAASIALLTPGISVIKDAVETARKIFVRMYSYVVYRITESIRILFFITLAIMILKLYPITPVMIILLALLNDLPILAIAYDNAKVPERPAKWNIRLIITVSSILGILGVIGSFLILWISLFYLALPIAAVQTFIFLKLAVAGHLTIFVTRTHGPFWSVKPGFWLVALAAITKIIATVFAIIGGGLMYPLTPFFAGVVWAYAIAWFLVADVVKVLIYKHYDTLGRMISSLIVHKHF